MSLPHPIALLTDFGTQDWFVGAMRGEILKLAPAAIIFDLTHAVPPQNIAAGAFALRCALDSLPQPCVICAVVDPGVGSPRRAICGRIGPWFFSGPDNGLATPLLEHAADDFTLHQIESPEFQTARDRSNTFHGRDLFAPAAAQLALGRDPAQAGPRVTNPRRLLPDRPELQPNGLRARIAWIDHFGNLLTNITPADLPAQIPRIQLRAGSLRITTLQSTYTNTPPGAPLAYWGSAGVLEIALNQASAAQTTALQIGDPIDMTFT